MPDLITPPDRLVSENVQSALLVLKYAHGTSKSFLDSFESIRTSRSATGTPTDSEQDLLRAMLLFASSGLDSMLKHLIKEALPIIIERNEGALRQFRTFTERKIISKKFESGATNIDAKLLAQLFTDTSPRKVMTDVLLRELTGNSIQSKDQLLKVATHFGITPEDLNVDVYSLKRVFEVRNQITHEMDIDFSQPNRNRVPRRRDDMIEMTNLILQTSDNFLRKVDSMLSD